MMKLDKKELLYVSGAGICACCLNGSGFYIGKTKSMQICNDHCLKKHGRAGTHRIDPECDTVKLGKCFLKCNFSLVGVSEWAMDGDRGPATQRCIDDCRQSICPSVPVC